MSFKAVHYLGFRNMKKLVFLYSLFQMYVCYKTGEVHFILVLQRMYVANKYKFTVWLTGGCRKTGILQLM